MIILSTWDGAPLAKNALRDLIRFLNEQTRVSFKGLTVDTYLEEHPISLDEVAPFVRFRQDCYARNELARNENYELIAVAWLGGQVAPIHDHAGQRCWMAVLSGELTSQEYAPITTEEDAPLAMDRPILHGAGNRLYIDDAMGLHRLGNESTRPAISLHLYAAPITHCHVYDSKENCFKLVELRSFPAWFEEEERPELPEDLESPESSG